MPDNVAIVRSVPAALKRSRVRALTATYVALFLVSQLPLYIVQYVDITDFPNHSARFHVLHQLSTSATLQQYYQAVPKAIFPNLAMELIVPLLGTLVGATLALKLFASISTLLMTSGAIALGFSLTGRVTYVTLGAVLFANNAMLGFGLFNYIFGLGAALWLLSAWIAAGANRNEGACVAGFTLGAIFVYFCHLSAFGVYAITILGLQGRVVRRSIRLVDPIATLFPLACVAVLHVAVSQSPHDGMSGSAYGSPLTWLLYKIAIFVLAPATAVSRYPIVGGSLGAALAATLYLGLRSGSLWFSPNAFRVFLPSAVAAAVLPPAILGSSLADIRVLLAVVTLLWCSLDLRNDRLERPIGIAVVASVLFISTATSIEWAERDGDYRSIRQALSKVEHGARIATIVVSGGETRVSPHVAAWAAEDRDAFVANLFSRPFQPVLLSYTYPYVALATLARIERVFPAEPPRIDAITPCFDYILVVGTRADRAALHTAGEKLLYDSGDIHLMRTDTSARHEMCLTQ